MEVVLFINKNLKVKFVGGEDYRPRNVPYKRFIRAVGFETRMTKKTFDGVEKTTDELYFLVINDEGYVVPVAAFNCVAIIDDSVENDILRQLAETLAKSVMLLKTLSDLIAKNDSSPG